MRTTSVVPLHCVESHWIHVTHTLNFSCFWNKQNNNENSFYDAITTEKHWSSYRLWVWVFVMHTHWLLRDSVITMLIEKVRLRIWLFVAIKIFTITKGIKVNGTASICSAFFECCFYCQLCSPWKKHLLFSIWLMQLRANLHIEVHCSLFLTQHWSLTQSLSFGILSLWGKQRLRMYD